MSSTTRILSLLREKHSVTNLELSKITWRFGRTLEQLRKDHGIVIRTDKTPQGNKQWLFTYTLLEDNDKITIQDGNIKHEREKIPKQAKLDIKEEEFTLEDWEALGSKFANYEVEQQTKWQKFKSFIGI